MLFSIKAKLEKEKLHQDKVKSHKSGKETDVGVFSMYQSKMKWDTRGEKLEYITKYIKVQKTSSIKYFKCLFIKIYSNCQLLKFTRSYQWILVCYCSSGY